MTQHLSSTLKSVLFCFLFCALYLLIYFIKSPVYQEYERIPHAIIGIVVGGGLTWFFLRQEKNTFRSIGLFWESRTPLRFFKGIGMGILIMGIMTAAVIFFSGFSVSRNTGSNLLKFLWGTLPLLPLAFMEELAFRGYPFETLREKTSGRATIYISALLFGLYHLTNGWTIQNALLGAGVWGIIFGLAALVTKGIALPTGLHYAVNMTTSAFGIADGSYHVWTLKDSNGGSLAHYQSSTLETLLPPLVLLVLGVAGVEWYSQKIKKG